MKALCGTHKPLRHRLLRHDAQAGLTIVELMVAITLGLLVSMAATALLLSSKLSYTVQDESTRMEETGRYAIELIARAVHQAAYENWGREASAIVNNSTITASIAGLDARSLKESEAGINAPVTKSVNGSDVLAVRFIGAGVGPGGDGTMLNCAGLSVAEPVNLENDRGWSIFYIGVDQTGEPELRCKYYGKTSWNSEAIARGVESLQLLYGIDTDGDELANQFLTATQVDDLDNALILESVDAAAKAAERLKKTNWKKVAVVKVALLVRGSQNTRTGTSAKHYDLFGKDYAMANGLIDIGTRVDEASLPSTTRYRLRKIFMTTIQLRSHMHGAGT